MIIRLITVIGVLLSGGATVADAAPVASAAITQVTRQQDSGATGWRFRKGNICVQDQTAPKLSAGVWRAAVAWSKAEDINVIWRRDCAGFSQAQTITVVAYAWDTYDGVCDRAHVWTQHGYLKPGLVTRAVVQLNTACNVAAIEDRAALAAHALGKPLGLSEQAAGSPATVMSSAWLPTARDYRLVEQIYPWK